MKILNLTKQTTLAEQADLADTFLTRMIGLLNRKSLKPRTALVIGHCQSIHMFFMRFAIDAIFVDRDDRVVGLVEGIKPFRLSPIFFKASYCIELPEGSIQQTKTCRGDLLKLDKTI